MDVNLADFDRPKVFKKRFFACTVQPLIKSTQYKDNSEDKWAVEVFRTWQAACEQKFCILDLGSMFKDYYLYCVPSLEEKLEDLANLSLYYWLTKFVQEIANKNEIVNSARGMFTELKKKNEPAV